MIGIIQAVKPSKSGKTLGVQIGGQWYSTKSPELAQMVGQSITFESSVQEFPGGGTCTWLNDYTIDNAPTHPTPAAQAMDQRMAQNVDVPFNQHAPPNKDALISALALTKSVIVDGDEDGVEAVWKSFVYFYRKMVRFNALGPETDKPAVVEPPPVKEPPPMPHPDDFDDDIPF